MQLGRNFVFTSWLAMLLLAAGCRFALAGEPTEAIRGAIDRSVEVLKNGKLRDRNERAQVIDRLRQILYPQFDFREMAMRSLGSHWRALDAQQQKEFVAVFTKLLEKNYANDIDLYDGQQVIYTGETIDGDYAVVDSRLIAKDKQKYTVSYKLHKVDGNVVAENISVVNNYREQFNRTILNSSFPELLTTMKQKAS
jgi:phospholipid transport system substrate-binding protein